MNSIPPPKRLTAFLAVDFSHGPRQVSANHRYLVHADATPFFYLGDADWELFHRATIEETEQLIENRRAKGFTVLQTVGLAFLDGLTVPNAYGDLPTIDGDASHPAVTPGDAFSNPDQYDYWDHVDRIIDLADRAGLYIGFLPTWVEHVESGALNPTNVAAYGRFLGQRFGQRRNIIWILGGDPRTLREELPMWRALASAIREGHGGGQLMTYHPRGQSSSSTKFHHDEWLDFNMIQSGHHSLGHFQLREDRTGLRPRTHQTHHGWRTTL